VQRGIGHARERAEAGVAPDLDAALAAIRALTDLAPSPHNPT
jgi:hypothetical protein